MLNNYPGILVLSKSMTFQLFKHKHQKVTIKLENPMGHDLIVKDIKTW